MTISNTILSRKPATMLPCESRSALHCTSTHRLPFTPRISHHALRNTQHAKSNTAPHSVRKTETKIERIAFDMYNDNKRERTAKKRVPQQQHTQQDAKPSEEDNNSVVRGTGASNIMRRMLICITHSAHIPISKLRMGDIYLSTTSRKARISGRGAYILKNTWP